MARHLCAEGHDVQLVSYDRGIRNLQDEFSVFETEGLRLVGEDNTVNVVKTIVENLARLKEGHQKYNELKRTLFGDFQPDCVITDFEPMTAYLANQFDIPLITLDNQHRMRYMEYEYPPGLAIESQVTKTIIRAVVPRPDVSLTTTFFFGKTTNARTFLFPPIVRGEVLGQHPEPGSHVLVYLTRGFNSLLDLLKELRAEHFLVYGYDRTDEDQNLTFKRPSSEGFLSDLVNSKAVIATAGFTLIGEALYLRKPYLALPMKNQFEQQLNAYQLEQLGFGKGLPRIKSEAVREFLFELPGFERRLKYYQPGDNDAIKSKLDELLANDCTAARRYHGRRASP